MVVVALLLDFQSVSMWPPEVIMGNTSPVSSVPISSNDKIAIQVNQSPVHEVKNAEDEGLAKTHSPDRPDDPGRALAVCQQMNSPSSSEKIQSSACSMESTKSKIPSLTLQQYRKEVGLKVQNKKRCQKLGISVSS